MTPEPIGLVFPGQGTQRPGMGEPWRDTDAWPIAGAVSEWTGEDVGELLLRTGAEELRRTDLAQIAVFTVAMMAHDEARRAGLTADAVVCAGHSLGEYAALAAAGALPLRDAALLVAARGRAMREAAELRDGTMGVLVGAPLEAVEGLVREIREEDSGTLAVWVANVNGPGQLVVSGSEEGVARTADEAPRIGAKLIRVPVGGAFHSPFMEPAAGLLRKALERVEFAPRHLPVVANADARAHAEGADWPELAVRQLTSPVRWDETVRLLTGADTGAFGCRKLLEIGPGKTLAGLIRRIDPEAEVVAVDTPAAAKGQRG